MKDFKLFDYQEKCIQCICEDSSHSQLVSMPTGTGKTITFLSLAKLKNLKTLILVNREELLNQTLEKSKSIGIDENKISVITAKEKNEFNQINVAMVITLCRNLEKYREEDIDFIIVDEAHHSTAPSYLKIFDHFKIFDKKKLLIGFTATPLRGDKNCLSSIYMSHSFKMTLSEATQKGYIVPVAGYRFHIEKCLDDIETVNGDFDISKLDKIMNCDEINELISEKCENLSKTPSIIFCTSVEHASKIAENLRKKNRKAVSISYKNSSLGVKTIHKFLKMGKIEFITNAVKLSEGFDFPPIQSILIARPTRSPVLYKQMIGRGLRNYPGKESCIVFEFTGNDENVMKWEDIDNNSTFQSYSSSQKKSREEALKVYRNKFKSPGITILDVRVSPFDFYECFIRRIIEYKKYFMYCPFTDGVCIGKIEPVEGKWGGNYFNLNAGLFLYQKKLQTLKLYENDFSFASYSEMGRTKPEILKFFDVYCTANKLGSWYPSEHEDMRKDQSKIIKEKTNARKAAMMIEDIFIKKFIDKYFHEDEPKLNGLLHV